jgi:ABC-type phosphate transport system substrate-binding protein
VIVNPKNPTAALTAEQVAALYLGNATTFPGGGPAALVDQPEAAGIRGTFYQKAIGRSVAQVRATWARITFTGKGMPPKELKSDADVKAFVAADPQAIGYVDASAVDSSVKAVLKL